MSFEREWICCFCLTVSPTKGPVEPKECVCNVVRCETCASFIKGKNPKICHGCGNLFPTAIPAFVGTDQTASVYTEADWLKRNKGWLSEGNFCISTGIKREEDGTVTRYGAWIAKELDNGKGAVHFEDVRELTTEEIDALSDHDVA